METACVNAISWLEKSGYLPAEAFYDLECAKDDIVNSVLDFVEGAKRLTGSDNSDNSDNSDPRLFAEQLMMIKVRTQDLRNDIQSLEEALRKTVVALPDGIFEQE